MICFDDTNDTGTDYADLARRELVRLIESSRCLENNDLLGQFEDECPICIAIGAIDDGDLAVALARIAESITLAATPLPPQKKPTQKHLRAVDQRAEALKSLQVARVLVRIALAATSTTAT